MKTVRWQFVLGALLVVTSLVFFVLRWVLFPGDALHNEMLRYLLDDVAFLFVQVLIVTLFIDGLLRRREREAMLQKLNMVIGAFFSQLGTRLLRGIAACDRTPDTELPMRSDWTDADFARAKTVAASHLSERALTKCDLVAFRELLSENKPFLLGLLGNQSLLEHETFTDLLWAVTHLAEELEARADLRNLEPSDRAHLAGDIRRAYGLLIAEWYDYAHHLKANYPYLYSLALRTDPLDSSADPVVKN